MSKNGLSILFIATILFGGSTFFLHPQTQSASLTEASVTLSNSRLSFRARLDSGNTVGSSIVDIKTSTISTHTSGSTAQIRKDDPIIIGSNSYTVLDTNPPGVMRLTTGLLSGDNTEDTTARVAQTTNLTVRFRTASAINNGSFRVLVPAAASNAADGDPDPGFFDYGTVAPTVTCPTNQTGYTFSGPAAAASAVTINGQAYHSFTCSYTGAGGVGTDFTTGAQLFTINGLINPAPRTGHTDGVANSHTLLIQHLDSSNTVQDATSVAVGVVEAVKITATVAPVINFSITGVTSGTSKCGVNTDVTTSALEVPFGVLSLSNFLNAAQVLTVSTNAANGYAVTAIANDQLGRNGVTCPGDDTLDINCIRDSRGDNASMSHTTADEWNVTTTKGFGYSLAAGTGSPTVPFAYNSSAGSCTGAFCARHFADAEDSESPVSIMTHGSVADGHTIDVCYRVIPTVTNAAGEYQNSVTYTATATF